MSQTTPPRLDAPPFRRLLNIEQMSEKLGYSVGWVYDNRAELERLGFPRPVLGLDGAPGNAFRWDERAVDLWLDSRMPKSLRIEGEKARAVDIGAIDTAAMERRLMERAEGLAI